MMLPYRPFLSPKFPFEWNPKMNKIFVDSKADIIKAIEEGVTIFDPKLPTILNPDYSKTGIGYFLFQQHCSCESDTTRCCENGWRVVLAGSRFLRKSEQNYWPVEGEALTVKWALEDTKFFTWGCPNLIVQTDL